MISYLEADKDSIYFPANQATNTITPESVGFLNVTSCEIKNWKTQTQDKYWI